MGASANTISLGIELRQTPANADQQVARLTGLLATFREQAGKAFNSGAASAQQMATAVNTAIGGFQRMGQTIDVTNAKAVAAFRAEGDALAAYLVKLGATDAELNKIGATIAKVERESGAAGAGLFPAVPGATIASFDRLSPKIRTAANAASVLAFAGAGMTRSLSGVATAAGSLVTGLATLATGPIAAVAAGIGAIVVVTTTVIELFQRWGEEAKKAAQDARDALAKDPRLEAAIETENQLIEVRQRADDDAVRAIIARTQGEDAARRAGIDQQFRREKAAVEQSTGLEASKSSAILALTKKRNADLETLQAERVTRARAQADRLATEELDLINKRTLTEAAAARAAAQLRFKEEEDRIAKERQQAAGNVAVQAELDQQLAAAARIRAETLDAIGRDEQAKQRAAITDANAQLLELTGRGADAQALRIQQAYEQLVEKLKKLGVANAEPIAKALLSAEAAKQQIDQLEQTIAQGSARTQARIAEVQALVAAGALSERDARLATLDALRQEEAQLRESLPLLEARAKKLNDPALVTNVAELRAQLAQVRAGIKATEDEANLFGKAGNEAIRSFSEGIAQGLDEMTDGVHSFADAWRDAAVSITSALRRIASEMLATLIIQKALSFLPFLGGGASIPKSPTGFAFNVFRKAEGGLIRGPGTPTSDSIPALLSDGEYVVNAAAVKAVGVSFLELLNRATVTPIARRPGRFAAGGLVAADDLGIRGGAVEHLVRVMVDAHPDLVVRALETSKGQDSVIAVASKRRNAFNAALDR